MSTKASEGTGIEYVVSGAAVTSGDVVVKGDVLGVIVRDTAVGETAVLAIEGAYTFTASEAIAVGEAVEYAAGKVAVLDAGVKVGVALTAAAADDDTITVKLER